MKLVVQRVSHASVNVKNTLISSIEKGYFVLLGIENGDNEQKAAFLAEKLSKLRVMADQGGKMNLTVSNLGGEMLIVSQFTLLGDTAGSNRPSFIAAARPDVAKPLYEYFIKKLVSLGVVIKTGEFGADMQIDAVLDGPVTILLEK